MKSFSLLTLAISILVSLVLCELVVRNFFTVRNVGPSFTVYDPIYGRVLKADFSARRYTPEFTMNITTNSEGFRGPKTGTDPILFLGDSFTLGYGVSDGEEYPQLVGEALGLSVLNRGIGNAGQAHWIKFLESEAQQYDPRLVVLQFLGNDYYDNARERLFGLVDHKLIELDVPKSSLKNALQYVIELIPGLTYSHLFSLTREISWSHSGRISSESTPPDETLTLEMVKRSIELCEENQWPVLLVITEVTENQLQSLQNLPVETLVLPNKSSAPEFFFQIDGHWNTKGHAMAAQQIVQRIKEDDDLNLIIAQDIMR